MSRILFVIEPIATINPNKDTTYLFMHEAQRRGHESFACTPEDLCLENGVVSAFVTDISVPALGQPVQAGSTTRRPVTDFAVVFMRHDPPYDMRYLSAGYVLNRVHPHTPVLNTPASVLTLPEKIYPTLFADLMPPTLVSRHPVAIADFHKAHGDIVLKPLYSCGGEGVFHLKPADPNLKTLIELFDTRYPGPWVAQKFLPEVSKGDKRILFCNGEVLGAVLRVPQIGSVRANFHSGGSGAATDLSPAEQALCARIGQSLKDNDLFFVGIDLIGPWLTEINVTSPTGMQEMNALYGVRLQETVWDQVEKTYL
jgi:glutathione synthase